MSTSVKAHVSLFAALALVAAAATAYGDGEAPAPTSNIPGQSPAGTESAARTLVTATSTATSSAGWTTGVSPMPGGQAIPQAFLPPGSFRDDTGPSDVIFPPQKLTVRFNHKLHLTKIQGTTCATCHPGALTSANAGDRLLPPPTKCDNCHLSDHTNLGAVTEGPDAEGKCAFCHVGYREGDGNKVAPLHLPPPNLVFNHQKHAARNIGCAQCHGAVQELELATRDQMPRMRGCFNCHVFPEASARGSAKSDCTTCHITARPGDPKSGRLKVVFAQGALTPPRWLRGSQHTPDWLERHRKVAGSDSAFCANCHKEEMCVDCHDGRVRPRSVHPSDYLNMHAIEARMASQRCTSCHREQSFCLSCHQRVGVSMGGPTAVRESGRFHPPKAQWSDAPRKPGHHAQEAARNLNACVSCHTERDCASCHGGAGIGAGRYNPHGPGFAAQCASQMRRNARPCFVCHEPNAAALAMCR